MGFLRRFEPGVEQASTSKRIPLGVDNGYSLPNPNTLVVKNGASSTTFFTMWLKLRNVSSTLVSLLRLYEMKEDSRSFYYRPILVQTPQFRPLRADQWHSILGVGFSSNSKHKSDELASGLVKPAADQSQKGEVEVRILLDPFRI